MASAHIELDSTVRLGGNLRSLINELRQAQEDIDEAKSVYDQLAMGGDFAALGAALGLTGASAAANAEAIYNLIGSVQGEVVTNATFTNQLLSRLG